MLSGFELRLCWCLGLGESGNCQVVQFWTWILLDSSIAYVDIATKATGVGDSTDEKRNMDRKDEQRLSSFF